LQKRNYQQICRHREPTRAVKRCGQLCSVWLARIPAAIAGLRFEGIAGTGEVAGGLRLADIRRGHAGSRGNCFAGDSQLLFVPH